MGKSEIGQVNRSAVEVYEECFLPALFQEWAGRVVDAAHVAAGQAAGQRVLDVACDTGVVTRAVLERVGAGGAVVGLDRNDGMLAVARRRTSSASSGAPKRCRSKAAASTPSSANSG